MKKYGKFLSFIFLMNIMNSCSIEPTYSVTYYFHNETGVAIFIPDQGPKNTDIHISVQGTFEVTYGGRHDQDPFPNYGPVKVIFGNEKIITYQPNDFDVMNTPLYIGNYITEEVPTKGKKSHVFKRYYTFTKEQYDSAEPLEQ